MTYILVGDSCIDGGWHDDGCDGWHNRGGYSDGSWGRVVAGWLAGVA